MIKNALCLLMALVSTLSYAQTNLVETSETPLESKIAGKVQEAFSQNKQELFLIFHYQGNATGVTVSNVKITQWTNGTDTEVGSDVVQFTVHYTLYWSSILHHGNGFTEATSVFNVDDTTKNLTCVGNQLIKTNGKFLKGDTPTISKGLSGILAKYALHLLL